MPAGRGGGAGGLAGAQDRLREPADGPLAGFGEADNFVLGGVRKALGTGIDVAGQSYPVEILVRDSQSEPEPRGEVAPSLILTDKST